MKKHLKKAAQLIVSASVGYRSASFLFSKGVGEQEAVALGVGVAYLTNEFFDEGLPALVEKAKAKAAEKKEVVDDEDDDDDFFDDDDDLFEDEEAEEEPAPVQEPEPEAAPEEEATKEAPKKGATKKK